MWFPFWEIRRRTSPQSLSYVVCCPYSKPFLWLRVHESCCSVCPEIISWNSVDTAATALADNNLLSSHHVFFFQASFQDLLKSTALILVFVFSYALMYICIYAVQGLQSRTVIICSRSIYDSPFDWWEFSNFFCCSLNRNVWAAIAPSV